MFLSLFYLSATYFSLSSTLSPINLSICISCSFTELLNCCFTISAIDLASTCLFTNSIRSVTFFRFPSQFLVFLQLLVCNHYKTTFPMSEYDVHIQYQSYSNKLSNRSDFHNRVIPPQITQKKCKSKRLRPRF